MVDHPDAEKLLGWMKSNCRQQPWRMLRNGRDVVVDVCVVELSTNKLRIVLNMKPDQLAAAMKYVFEKDLAVPLGRMLPLESSQTAELWMVR